MTDKMRMSCGNGTRRQQGGYTWLTKQTRLILQTYTVTKTNEKRFFMCVDCFFYSQASNARGPPWVYWLVLVYTQHRANKSMFVEYLSVLKGLYTQTVQQVRTCYKFTLHFSLSTKPICQLEFALQVSLCFSHNSIPFPLNMANE